MEEQKENSMKTILLGMFVGIMMTIMVTSILSSCTYTITQIHTEGQASDVVDDTDNITPTTSLSVPISAIK